MSDLDLVGLRKTAEAASSTSGPKRVQMTRNRPWRAQHPDAVIVDRRTRWGNPFIVGDRGALARVPAIHHEGREWEHEGRISAAGMRHDFYHPGGKVTRVDVRAMTLEETVLAYRAYMTGGGWPLNWEGASLAGEIKRELAGKDLACWCSLDMPCHADVLLEIANGGDDD